MKRRDFLIAGAALGVAGLGCLGGCRSYTGTARASAGGVEGRHWGFVVDVERFMECLTFQVKRIFSRTIYSISKKWMADTGHMYTDLMGTSCFQAAFHIRILSKPFQNLIMSDSVFSVFVINCHFFPVCRVTPDRTFNGSCVFF